MIVLPMGGLSSRFFNAGYRVPKYQLDLHGKTVFERVLGSFNKYFESERFLFIAVNSSFDPKSFLLDQLKKWPQVRYDIVILNEVTQGQAETVYLGLKSIEVDPDERITIFNIDTFRPNFEIALFDGEDRSKSYLETFVGAGKNWSNVVPIEKGSDRVRLALEKQEASEFCCTGIYQWRTLNLFAETFRAYSKSITGGELYVAPMYNYAIEKGEDVRFNVIPPTDVIFCGTPDEYELLVSNPKLLNDEN